MMENAKPVQAMLDEVLHRQFKEALARTGGSITNIRVYGETGSDPA